MIRKLFLVLLGAALACSELRAADASGAALFKDVDTGLAQAGLLFEEARSEAAVAAERVGPQDAASCRRAFSFESLLRGIGKPPLEFGRLSPRRELVMDIGWHYRCLAVASKDPTQCRALKPFSSDEAQTEWEYGSCEAFYEALNLNRALLAKDPGAVGLCVQFSSRDAMRIARPEDLPAFCDGLTKYSGDAVKTCARLTPLMIPSARKTCLETVGALNGRQDCAELAGSKRTVCAEYAAFRKAHAAKKADLCGDHPLCRVMFAGDGAQSCRTYVERAKEKYCAMTFGQKNSLLSGPDSRGEAAALARDEAFDALLREARAALLKAEPSVLDLGLTAVQEIDRREAKIVVLQARYALVREKLSPASPPLR